MEYLSSKDGNQDSLFPNGVCSNWYAFISLHSFWNQSGRRPADYILKRRNPGWVQRNNKTSKGLATTELSQPKQLKLQKQLATKAGWIPPPVYVHVDTIFFAFLERILKKVFCFSYLSAHQSMSCWQTLTTSGKTPHCYRFGERIWITMARKVPC